MFKINEELCTGCQNCCECCPCGAITYDEEKNICHLDSSLCADCGSCSEECPFGAIEEIPDEDSDDESKN